MSKAAIAAIAAALEGLRDALDGRDPAAIDAAGQHLHAATSNAGAIGAWRADPELRERLKALLPRIDSARIRANVLSDQARQSMAMLADHGASTAPLTYGR